MRGTRLTTSGAQSSQLPKPCQLRQLGIAILDHGLLTRLVEIPSIVEKTLALDPDIISQARECHVGIELDGSLTRGATVVDWEGRLQQPANARIILGVDQARFEARIKAALAAA